MVHSERFSIAVQGFQIVGEIHYPPPTGTLQPVLCICHGIPAAVPVPGDRGYPLLAERFAAAGFITGIFNFRGCGESEGNLDLVDWTHDLEGVITCLSALDGVDTARLSLMGFSGGAATCAVVAARDQRITAVVLCACPAQFSIGALGRNPEDLRQQCLQVGTIRDAAFPPSIEEWAAHFEEVSPIEFIDRIAPRPLLIVHGDADETIPPAHASQLFALAGEPRKLVMIPCSGHKLRHDETAMTAAMDWLKGVNRLT